MGLFDLFKKDKTDVEIIAATPSGISESQDLDEIIGELKRLTEKKCIRLNFSEEKNVDVLKSKLGGAPYFEENEEYPVDSKGESMPLLIQINLSELPVESDLPKNGMLQFFISNDMDTECRVIYREKISAEKYAYKNGINVMPNDGFSPVLKECGVRFMESKDYICVNDNSFDDVLHTAVINIRGKEIDGDMYDNFSDSDCEKLCEKFSAGGSKLFGNPCFTQCDAREENSGEELLLQIDSDDKLTMWGDLGVGNFFIKNDDLKKLDFSKVLYSWDCG